MSEPRYLYLPDSPFHTDFSEAVGESTDTYTVYVSAYSMPEAFTIDETAAKIPYLRFLSIRENDTYTFPHIECTTTTFDSEYTQYMMNLLDRQVTADMPSTLPFKPEHVLVNGKSVMILFSFDRMVESDMFRDFQLASTMKWAIVDEIVFERNIMGVPFDANVTAVFMEHESIWNIEYDRVYIDFPFSVYAVGEINDALANVSSDVHKTDLYSHHEDYGDRYCFSYLPIGDTPELTRYAVYTYKTKYLVDCPPEDGAQMGGYDTQSDKGNADSTPRENSDTEDSLKTPIDSLENSESGVSPIDDSLEKSESNESLETQESGVSLENPESGVSLETHEKTPDDSLENPESSESPEKPESGVSPIDDSLEKPESGVSPIDDSLENPESGVSPIDDSLETPESGVSPIDDSLETHEKTPDDSLETHEKTPDDSLENPESGVSLNESANSKITSPEDTIPPIDSLTPPETPEPPMVLPTPDSNNAAMEESERDGSKLAVPTIYFVENIHGKNVTMWGFMSPELFVKL